MQSLSGNPWLSSRGGKKDGRNRSTFNSTFTHFFCILLHLCYTVTIMNRLARRETSHGSQTVSLRYARQTVHLARIGMRVNALSASSTCGLLSVRGARLKTLGEMVDLLRHPSYRTVLNTCWMVSTDSLTGASPYHLCRGVVTVLALRRHPRH